MCGKHAEAVLRSVILGASTGPGAPSPFGGTPPRGRNEAVLREM